MKLKNNALQELYATVVHCAITISPHAESLIEKAFRECDDEFSGSAAFAHIKNLQERNDILEKTNGTLLSANMDLASKNRKLDKDLDDAQKLVSYYRQSRGDWRDRAKHAEKEVEELKTDKKRLEETLQDTKANADLTELREDYAKLIGENRRLNARIDCLHKVVEWYRKHHKEQSYKIRELESRLNSIYGD